MLLKIHVLLFRDLLKFKLKKKNIYYCITSGAGEFILREPMYFRQFGEHGHPTEWVASIINS